VAAALSRHARDARLRTLRYRPRLELLHHRPRSLVDGHIAAPEDNVDVDSWSHHLERGTHRALAVAYPRSGLLQGAEPYLRWLAHHKHTRSDVAATLREALTEWEAQPGRAETGHPATV